MKRITKTISKHVGLFLQSDYCNYYSSINEIILNKYLILVAFPVCMPMEEIDMIRLVTKSMLEFIDKQGIRTYAMNSFDLIMSSSHSVQASHYPKN